MKTVLSMFTGSVEEARQEFPQKAAGEQVDLALDLDDRDAAVLVTRQP